MLIGFGIFDQSKKRVQDDGGEQDVEKIPQRKIGPRIYDVLKHNGLNSLYLELDRPEKSGPRWRWLQPRRSLA